LCEVVYTDSKKEFTLELVDLNEATREVIALSSGDLQKNRVVLQSEFADDLRRKRHQRGNRDEDLVIGRLSAASIDTKVL
jgi:hypothetical protein